MNFIVGFILMVSGSREKESFWFFSALLSNQSYKTEPYHAGLSGFYCDKFPLLVQYINAFKIIFEEEFPDLYEHFEEENIPDLLWINKWF